MRDAKIDVKIKLAALWVTLMFFYLYRDVLGFMEPGHVEDLLAGELAGVRMTEALLAAPSLSEKSRRSMPSMRLSSCCSLC
jgi:hypothetical protein